MSRCLAVCPVIILTLLGGMLLVSTPGNEAAPPAVTATPTYQAPLLVQPATVVPPSQADNGAQIYWGMCSPCHGDQGQGLTVDWRTIYGPDQSDCWQSGCHGNDFPENSFKILETGAPALAGPGKLTRFSNALELQSFIHANMPFFPPGSLTTEESLSLTAYVLRLNGKQPAGLTFSRNNLAAIPIHRAVAIPGKDNLGIVLLVGVMILATTGLTIQYRRKITRESDAAARPHFFGHLHPPSIPAEQSRFRYSLGAGGISFFLLVILILTGLLEMYYYIPSPEKAAISVETIATLVPFGSLVRNLHFWSAQFLVVLVTLHLLRVILTGAYASPRRFNYLLGLGLFVLVLLLDFTGYMLRWDEGIRWALVVGTNLLKTIPGIGDKIYVFVIGGSEPGAATLTRFYTWHIFGLALAASILVAWHIFRVRRDGGIAVPPPIQRQEKSRITRSNLLRRETQAMLVTGIVLLLFSIVVPAPIDSPIASANALTGDSSAPWFFLWIQQLLKLGNPFWLGVFIPIIVIIILGLLPYGLPNAKRDELGHWFPAGNRIARLVAVVILAAIVILTFWGALANL